jgi:hypothetical protein
MTETPEDRRTAARPAARGPLWVDEDYPITFACRNCANLARS